MLLFGLLTYPPRPRSWRSATLPGSGGHDGDLEAQTPPGSGGHSGDLKAPSPPGSGGHGGAAKDPAFFSSAKSLASSPPLTPSVASGGIAPSRAPQAPSPPGSGDHGSDLKAPSPPGSGGHGGAAKASTLPGSGGRSSGSTKNLSAATPAGPDCDRGRSVAGGGFWAKAVLLKTSGLFKLVSMYFSAEKQNPWKHLHTNTQKFRVREIVRASVILIVVSLIFELFR